MTGTTLAVVKGCLSNHTPRQADSTGRTEAAVAIVLAVAERTRLDLLFIKRAEIEGDPWSGQMAFPGGRREPRDRDLLETARRETWEEVGIHLKADTLLGVLDDLAPLTPTLPPILVRPFVFGLIERPGVTLSGEVAMHLWTPLDDLPRQRGEAEITIRGDRLTMPAFAVGPHVIWGMTHRIINSLLNLTF